MRFLKYFEAATYMGGSATPDELMVKYADDIVRVLPLYYNSHSTDSLHNQIDELIWDCREADRLRGDAEVLTEEVVRQLIEDLTGNFYEIDNLLNVYYDCIPFVKLVNKNLVEDIKEVFLEYSDMGQVEVSKTSRLNDDRYSVNMYIKDILFKINFEEVLNRIKELGFEHYSIECVKNGYTESMTIEFWKPLPKDKE